MSPIFQTEQWVDNIPTVAVAFIFVLHVSILGQLVNLLYNAAFLLPVLYTGSKKAVFKTIVISSSILQYIVCRENIRLTSLHSLLVYCCCFRVRADCCTTSPEETKKE